MLSWNLPPPSWKIPASGLRLARYLFLALWAEEIAALDVRLLDQSIAEHDGDFARGTHSYVTTNPLFLTLNRKLHQLNRQASRARLDWKRAKRMAPICQTVPYLSENKPVVSAREPLVMAAAANASVHAPFHSHGSALDSKSGQHFRRVTSVRRSSLSCRPGCAGLAHALQLAVLFLQVVCEFRCVLHNHERRAGFTQGAEAELVLNLPGIRRIQKDDVGAELRD